jgi:hypothetical protein
LRWLKERVGDLDPREAINATVGDHLTVRVELEFTAHEAIRQLSRFDREW